MNSGPQDWPEWNQRRLMTAVDRVRGLLERHAARVRGENPDAAASALPQVVAEPEADADGAADTLVTLGSALRLSPFELDVLLLCAAVELDARFPALCAAAQGDPHRTYATFGLALAALPGAHWSALAPVAALRHWRLLEVGSGESLTAAPLRVDERILHFLAGIDYLDERLQGLLWPLRVPEDLPPSHAAVAERILTVWTRPTGAPSPPVVELCGNDHGGKLGIAGAVGDALGLRVYTLHAAEIPHTVDERETFARLWEREALLIRGALLVDRSGDVAPELARGVLALVERIRGIVMLASPEPLAPARFPVVRLEVDRAPPDEQRSLWKSALGAAEGRLNGHLAEVVAQFSLSTEGIRATGQRVLEEAGERGEVLAERLWEACRVQARARLEDLAQRIAPAATWDDLVLPAAQRDMLREITVQIRNRFHVYERWGFAAKGRRGLGISALFAGPSGTGKTMAAEVLAGELRLDLFRIDLSSVVSKYIGETEKNLRRIFDAAEEGGAILLFDEADALFGRRSEVKDSHDRYANLEVSYLLQRMEAYRGLAILTSNLPDALDPAFLRRIRFVVHFPFPEAQQRAEIWRRIFPAATPTDGLEPEELALLQVPGGNIRNIALGAAFLAADDGEPVRMSHVLRAARSEYIKLERPVTELETGGGR